MKKSSVLFFLADLFFIICSAVAGVEIWLSILNIALLESSGLQFIEPQYENSVIPTLILVVIVLGYAFLITYARNNNRKNLIAGCCIITLTCCMFAPLILSLV